MKIGIITFHRATNHGAVLQTYASQKYIREHLGFDAEVIDYWPQKRELILRNVFSLNRPKIMIDRLKKYSKEKKIAFFRVRNIHMSKRYYSNEQLKNECKDYNVLICGSDQIWNPSYFLHGDGRNIVTPVYFLNFGGENVKRIALSVSFGCTEYPRDVGEKAKCFIEKFDAISVRENTGIDILNGLGINDVVVTADPTSLLEQNEYLELCNGFAVSGKPYVALSMLRSQNKRVKRIVKKISSLNSVEKSINIVNNSIEEWLAGIRDAEYVITNSFHCVMMCLKLHTPFFVVNEKAGLQGMNDRFYTLLSLFDMTDRIIEKMPDNAFDIPNEIIDWVKVDKRMREYSDLLKKFLEQNLKGTV